MHKLTRQFESLTFEGDVAMRVVGNPLYIFVAAGLAVLLVGFGVAGPQPAPQRASIVVRLDKRIVEYGIPQADGSTAPLDQAAIKDQLRNPELLTAAGRAAKLLPSGKETPSQLAKELASIERRVEVEVSPADETGDLRVTIAFVDNSPEQASRFVTDLANAFIRETRDRYAAEAKQKYDDALAAAQAANRAALTAETELTKYLDQHFDTVTPEPPSAEDVAATPAEETPAAVSPLPSGLKPAPPRPGQIPPLDLFEDARLSPGKALIEALRADRAPGEIMHELRDMPSGPYDPATMGDMVAKIQFLPKNVQLEQLEVRRAEALETLTPEHPYVRRLDVLIDELRQKPDEETTPPEPTGEAEEAPDDEVGPPDATAGYRQRMTALQQARTEAQKAQAAERAAWETLVHRRAVRIDAVGDVKVEPVAGEG